MSSSLLSPLPTPATLRRDWRSRLSILGALLFFLGACALVFGGATATAWLAYPALPKAAWARWSLEAPIFAASGLLTILASVVAVVVGAIALDVRRERRLGRPFPAKALATLSEREIELLRALAHASRHERLESRLHPPRPELRKLRRLGLAEVLYDNAIGFTVYMVRADALALADSELARRDRALELSLEVPIPGKRSRQSGLSS